MYISQYVLDISRSQDSHSGRIFLSPPTMFMSRDRETEKPQSNHDESRAPGRRSIGDSIEQKSCHPLIPRAYTRTIHFLLPNTLRKKGIAYLYVCLGSGQFAIDLIQFALLPSAVSEVLFRPLHVEPSRSC